MQNEKIKLENVTKKYVNKYRDITALDKVSIEFSSGKFYAIMGHSGSGKSTLVNILGLLDTPTEGDYYLYGKNVRKLSDAEQANLRKETIGFIFQDFYLDEYLKAIENVMLPMTIDNNIKKEEMKEKAIGLLKSLDLEDRINHFPKELSGGEKQRVAIARALANDPSIILADEPTGDLDENNEKKIFAILKKLSEEGKCVIVLSHSNEVKNYADKVYTIDYGKIVGAKNEKE